eukprot:m.778932 g.778932  ORF g.778932 m.778932 type:complete len:1027 (+) comp59124_c0_seq13:51-3131(+)
MSDDNVKVLTRCRPLNRREKDLSCKTVVTMHQDTGDVELFRPDAESEPPKRFTFDGAFGPDSCTRIIYDEVCFALVQNVLEGYNGTIFAYGQTGCGKSFSMEGIADDVDHKGITPRAFEHIFQHVAVQANAKFLVRASYLEIYNENIRDLLGRDAQAKLPLHEHPEKGVYVKDLSMNVVHSVADMIKLQGMGSKNRSVGATAMNADSSRSHSIFTVWIEVSQAGEDGNEHIRAGKLNLVDLAGSERQSKTQAEGDRLKEATKINLSLSALGNVISALVDGNAKHIPYRDSKLTRLLQDSLGGNTKTLMVACLSPADNNYEETLSTLRYANRAKNIKNKAKINEDPKDALLRQYQEEIEKLKALLTGQLPMDPSMLAALGLGAVSLNSVSPVPPQPEVASGSKKKAAASSTTSVETRRKSTDELEKFAEELREEKARELKEREEKLKSDFDTKLAELQDMYTQEKTTKERLEEEFERITELYNQQQVDLHEKIQLNQTQTATEVVRAAEEMGVVIPPTVVDQMQAAVASSPTEDPLMRTYTVEGMPMVSVSQAHEPAASSASPQLAGRSPRPMQYENVIVAGPRGVLMQAVVGSDCVPVRAMFGEDNKLVPKLNQFGNPVPIKGPDGQVAVPVDRAVASKVTILNINDEPIVAISTADGYVKSTLTEKGKLEVAVDEVGIPEYVQGKIAVVKSTTPPQPQAAVNPSKALEQVKAIEEVKAKLMSLQQNVVSGGAQAQNVALKEEMKSKKKKADQNLKKRLKEARARGDEEDLFGEIYDTLQDELKAKDKKITKIGDALQAARTEAADLQAEFEREREDMLETIRRQEKELKYYTTLADKVRTLIRPSCNYYNLEKIRLEAMWDEDAALWRFPRVINSDTYLPIDPHHGQREADSTSPSAGVRSSTTAIASARPRNISQVKASVSREPDIAQQERVLVDGEHIKQKRTETFLSKLEQRENEIAEQLDSRLSRFEARGPLTSTRAQQLLGGSSELGEVERRRMGPPEPGGVSLALGSPRTKRLNPLLRK